MTKPGSRPAAPQHRRKLAFVWAALALVLAAVVVSGILLSGPSPERAFTEVSLQQNQPHPVPAVASQPPAPAVDLPAEIQRIIGEHPDHRTGVAVLNTRDGQLQSYGDVAPYTAASTAKVLT